MLLLHTSLPECCHLPSLLHHHLHLRPCSLHTVLICTTQVGGTEWACWDAKLVHELHQGLLAAVQDNNSLTYCTLHGGERAELCLQSTKPHKGVETLIAILSFSAFSFFLVLALSLLKEVLASFTLGITLFCTCPTHSCFTTSTFP